MKMKMLVVSAVFVLLAATVALLAVTALAQTPGDGSSGPGGMMQPGATPGTGSGGMMGPGGSVSPQQGLPGYGWSPGGMMGPGGWGSGYGPGMMGGYGYGMMGGAMGGPYPPTVKAVDETQARDAVQKYLQSLGDQNLTFDEIHSFASNYYVPVKESDTGNYALELIVDRFGGTLWPEPGPNMMWNTKYGMMAGNVMGRGWGSTQQGQQSGGFTPTADTPITEQQARTNAEQFLNSYLPGAGLGEVHQFYGYRTIEVTRNNERVGMLSVNGYNGVVWYHTWHGQALNP